MLTCYAIKDNQVGAFAGSPFFVKSLVEAQRMLAQVVNDGQSQLAKFTEHFSLFAIGGFDDVTGEFTPGVSGPVFVMNLTELKKGGV